MTKPATETEEGSKARDCTVCDHVQTEIIPMLEHEHSYGDWQKDKTQHWKECHCGDKTEVGNHTFDDWTITKEPTTTETGSRERNKGAYHNRNRFQRTYLLHLQIYADRDAAGSYARCSR